MRASGGMHRQPLNGRKIIGSMRVTVARTLAGIPTLRSGFRPFAPPAALALVTAALLVVVPPVGDFPVADDWLYARMVKSLVERGQLQISPWTATTFVL